MKLLLLIWILSVACICTGCQRDLSVVEGVSVHSAQHQGWGQSPSPNELRLWGHTLADLGGRSVSPQAYMPSERVVSFLSSNARYDVTITAPQQSHGALCGELLERTFGVAACRSVREIDVLVLVPVNGPPIAMKTANPLHRPDITINPLETCRHGIAAIFPPPTRRVTYTFTSCNMENLAGWLEEYNNKVVVNETRQSDAYDFQLVTDPSHGITLESSLREIGLELRPARRKVTAIYVDTTEQATVVKIARAVHYSLSPRVWPVTEQ